MMFGEQGKCQMSKGGGKKRDGRDRPAFLSPLSLSEILCSAPSHWPAKNGLLLSPSELRAKRAPSGLAWHPVTQTKPRPTAQACSSHGPRPRTGSRRPQALLRWASGLRLGFSLLLRTMTLEIILRYAQSNEIAASKAANRMKICYQTALPGLGHLPSARSFVECFLSDTRQKSLCREPHSAKSCSR